MIKKGGVKKYLVFLLVVIGLASPIIANYYISDIYFVLPNTVYTTAEQMSFRGYIYESNYSDNGTITNAYSAKNGYAVNITIRHKTNETYVSNYTLTTDTLGAFYSNSTYNYNSTKINAPVASGDYIMRAQYIDGNETIKYSEVEFRVLNQSVDSLKLTSDKSLYNPSETITAEVEATSILNDKALYVNNVSINGTLRNNTKGIISNFNCTTDTTGKCKISITAPSTYGKYYLEANSFKAYSSFSVIPFIASAYMKDELGKSYKNTFALGEQASVEVSVVDNTTTASYSFSGYISDSNGNVIQLINTTSLTTNNSYTNKFVFTVNSISFAYGTYYATVNVVKSGDGNRTETTSFEVKDWKMTFNKRSTSSGFEYEYSAFPNKTLNFDAYPRYRSNASVIPEVNSTSFKLNLTDDLGNTLQTANVSWNTTCTTEGCYQFSLTSPTTVGRYNILLELSQGGSTQVVTRQINVINKVMQAQSTDSEGNVKELFGASEAAYITLTAYNQTATQVNLSNIEIFAVTYSNGTEMNYTNMTNFAQVNTTNTQLEWAVNTTSQRIKLDVPKFGGVYDLYIFAENRTVSGFARFIVNPYDICVSAKNTPGTVSSSSGQYYVWQFKTTDTVYFELKAIQANNPLGKATISNFSSNSSNGMGAACSVNTQTQQVINNATITVISVKNTQNGVTYAVNTSASVCISNDNSGGYTCTVQPAIKWDGGTYSAQMRITGPDGQTQDNFYGFFEARAFYLYGWSQTWQNRPQSNITLTVQMYEAGRNWWSSYGSGGLSGTISVEKVEYQGRDGEWIWPPISYNYNISAINSSSITTGQGTITLPVQFAPEGAWKTGYYRVILKGTDASGNTDYGYAWFGVKRWNAYGSPVECGATSCNYKSYINSKENITLYVQISNAGDYNYNYNGGENLGGNITIRVKTIQDCKTWPCKELNTSYYNSSSMTINQSNRWYWNANLSSSGNYILRINRTSGTWGTGWYNVVLDINGSETGNAYFNTVAFYVDTKPTNRSGDNTYWHYDIMNNEARYYNITTIKNYKGWGSSYNASDYINTSVVSLTLRGWDESTYQNKEFTYPASLNISHRGINGTAVINITYNNGSWPSGYYWGEIVMNNSDGETSTGWISFSVRPFRVSASTSSYQIGKRSCVNATIMIYEPSWSSSTLLTSNYTIQEVYETVWNGGGSTKTSYTNYSNSSFRNQTNVLICPNNGKWGSGSWGGYHYLNIAINDTQNNLTQNGWLSFSTVPFTTTWGSVAGGSNKRTNVDVNVTVTISGGTNTSQVDAGNLSRIYQWKYTGYSSNLQEYNFTVYANTTNGMSLCYSWTTGNCWINASSVITIHAPSGGWTVGGNYLYTEWVESDDVTSKHNDWYGIYINGQESYNGYYNNKDLNGNWNWRMAPSENLSIELVVRDGNYNNVPINITNVEYAAPSSSCYDEWCRTYTTATWSLVGGGIQTAANGSIIRVQKGTSNWAVGEYYIKTTVSGSGGTATIKGGRITVRDNVAPNVTMTSPTVNATYNGTNFTFSATTTETASCGATLMDYDRFNAWNCGSINSTNSTNNTQTGLTDSCNKTKYGLNGSYYMYQYISENYKSVISGPNYTYWYNSGTSGLSTSSTTHTYTFNTTDPTTNAAMRAQHYALQVYCYDSDWNYGNAYAAFKVNVSGT